MANAGIALRCDAQGILQQIVRDELGLGSRSAPGQKFIDLVDSASAVKAANFLEVLRANKAVFDWELNVVIGEETLSLFFAGGAVQDTFLIVGAHSRAAVEQFYAEEMAKIQNEQINFLRATLKEQTSEIRYPENHSQDLYNKMSRLNNELVNLQRELTKKNIALEESEHRYHTVLESVVEGIVLHDSTGTVRAFNTSACHILGLAPDQMIGSASLAPQWQAIHEDGTLFLNEMHPVMVTLRTGQPQTNVSMGIRKTDGTLCWISINTQPLFHAGETSAYAVVASFSDVTERLQATERLRYLSTHDILTGLYNRTFFEEELARLGQGRQFPLSVVIVDVNGLKQTNDQQGHRAGDLLLKRTAWVLTSAFRGEDIVARFGGDEFAILLPSTDAASAAATLSRIQRTLAEHNAVTQASPLSFSIGAATALKSSDLSNALSLADAQMYANKREQAASR